MCVVQGDLLILTKTGFSPPTPAQGTGPPGDATRDNFGWGKQWWAPFGRAAARRPSASIAQASARGLGFSFSPQKLKPFASAWANLILISLFCSGFAWLCLSSSSSSSGNSVSPPAPLNFLAAKRQPRQNQQLDWEGRSGGLELASPVMHRNNLNDFHNLTGLPGGRGTLIFPKPSAHFSSTYSSLGTESVILRNPRSIKSLPPRNPQFPVSPAKCPGSSLCPFRGSTEVEVGRQGRRSTAISPVFLHEEQGDGGIQRMPPTTNTRRFPGCLYTYCRQTNKKGIQTFPLCFTEHFNTNTNISQRLSRGEKKHEFCLWSKHQTADQSTSVHLNS